MRNLQNKIKKQFPNIYLTITENNWVKKYKNKVIVLLSGLILALLVLISVYSLKNILVFINLANQRQILVKKINLWNSISDKYEGYKDVYFQIAVLEYKIGNFTNAKKANNKALLLDPNFKDARKLEELINVAL